MEHIKVIDIDNEFKRLIPEEGYRLYNTITRKYYSEAEVKDVKPYIAVEI